MFHSAHAQARFPARSSSDPICQSLCERRCPSSIGNQKKRMSGGDMISWQIWGMKDKTVLKSCLSSVPDRCGLMCTIWLVAVNVACKTNECSRHINLTACKQTGVTQLSEYRFNIWCPNSWMHQMFDAFQQGTGSIKIKLGCCQLFGCESTFWGNSPTPKSLLMYMQKYINSFKVPVPLRLYIWSIYKLAPLLDQEVSHTYAHRGLFSLHTHRSIQRQKSRNSLKRLKSEGQQDAHRGSDQRSTVCLSRTELKVLSADTQPCYHGRKKTFFIATAAVKQHQLFPRGWRNK